MRLVERVKDMIRSWLEIQPAPGRGLKIRETVSRETNVLRNKIWYRGDASELDQLFKLLDVYKRQSIFCAVGKSPARRAKTARRALSYTTAAAISP